MDQSEKRGTCRAQVGRRKNSGEGRNKAGVKRVNDEDLAISDLSGKYGLSTRQCNGRMCVWQHLAHGMRRWKMSRRMDS